MQRFVLIPLIVACALFMENMDSTVITTSLPAIAQDIGESPIALKLALTSYLVALAVFIPISGWVADKFGARVVFASAIVVFMGGSLLCAVSESLAWFVAARFLQGMGGAMMVPVGRLVILRTAPKNELVSALNYLTLPALLGPIIGPPLGGLITLYLSWHWIFLINIPIGIVGLILVLRHIPNVREPEVPALDLRGFLLLGAGLSVLMLGLSAIGGHLVSNRVALACVAAGTLLVLGYVLHARRIAHPLVNLELLKFQSFHTGVVAGSLFRIGMGATPFLLPLLLQLGFGLDPFHSGLLTCATAAGAMFMKTLTVYILKRYGFRTVLVANGVLASASVAVCGLFTAATPHMLIVIILLASGCVRSLQFTALSAISFAEISRSAMSQASSVSSMTQRVTQSLGIVIGAFALEISSSLQGHETIVAADFGPAFFAAGLLSVSAILFHRRLPADAGSEISGHRIERKS